MKATTVGVMLTVAIGIGETRLATAQSTLQRLEQGIRAQAGPGAEEVPTGSPAAPPAVAPGRKATGERPYLGAVVDEQSDRGKGVRVLVVRPGGPAERGGLRPQDLIVTAASARVRQLSDLTAVIDAASPGDKVALEVLRGGRPQKLDVTLGAQIPVGPAETPPEAIPPPAAAPAAAPPNGAVAGPSLSMPIVPPPSPAPSGAPPAVPPPPPAAPPSEIGGPPTSDSARIEQLQRRVDELERRVQELERALAEAKKK